MYVLRQFCKISWFLKNLNSSSFWFLSVKSWMKIWLLSNLFKFQKFFIHLVLWCSTALFYSMFLIRDAYSSKYFEQTQIIPSKAALWHTPNSLEKINCVHYTMCPRISPSAPCSMNSQGHLKAYTDEKPSIHLHVVVLLTPYGIVRFHNSCSQYSTNPERRQQKSDRLTLALLISGSCY